MEKIKTTDKASISITRVKSVLVGLKETESNKVSTRVIRTNSYELVQFLLSVQNTVNKKPSSSKFLNGMVSSSFNINIKERGLDHCLHWM